MSDVWLLRTGILIAGVLLIAAIYFFGRPRRPGQGRRVEGGRGDGTRVEPTIGAQLERELAAGPDYGSDAVVQSEMDLLDRTLGNSASSELGRRGSEDFEKIVTLYIAARAGETLRGPDIVVAAEKAGLSYGHMNVFHRLVEGHPERGPVFSVA
ncbi:MAG: cell division protein ZipA C-terminal FtsZ-binding domain-containing protein, partial [Luteimonas sp.]